MTKKSTLFARLSLDYADHPKIISLSDAAFRAHITFILYCRKYETDGVIKNPVANRLALQWETDVLTELQNNDDDAPSLVQVDSGDYYLSGYSDMQETRAEIDARRSRNSQNGAKGGRPRKQKEAKTRTQSETHSVTESLTDLITDSGTQNKAETETETELYTSSTAGAASKTDAANAAFDDWYRKYPKKVGKGQARTAFKTALKKTDLETLKAGLANYNKTVEGKEREFIANPATWLNGERWEDDHTTQPQGDDSWNKLMNWTGQN